MTTAEYLKALDALGLTPAGQATAEALGLSLRQCQRYAAGDNVPKTLEKLLRLMLLARRRGMGDANARKP